MTTTGKFKALVCDDELLGRERIRNLLQERENIAVAAEARDGREAAELLGRDSFDLVFLDIQMPHLDGFEVVREVGPENMPPIIFVTAHDEFAVQAFQIHALDYLLKPFEPERFFEALDRVLAIIHGSRHAELNERVRDLIEGIEPRQEYLRRIMVRSRQHLEFVKVDDIDWIEAAGNYVELHLGRHSHLLRQTMKTLEQRLDPKTFVRIHRSAIVNMDRVKALSATFNGDYEVRLDNGKKLTLSRSYRHVLDRFS
jgi:two-component system LytT family response regulator